MTLRHAIRSRSVRRAATLLLLVVLVFGTMGAGGGTIGKAGGRFDTLGHKLMCMCGCNQVLLECNHVNCSYSDRMRAELQQYLETGDNDDLILQAFVQKYGNTVLSAPPASGFNLVAWVVPFLVLALATFFAAIVVKKWSAGAPAPAAAYSGYSAELDRYREQARKETEL